MKQILTFLTIPTIFTLAVALLISGEGGAHPLCNTAGNLEIVDTAAIRMLFVHICLLLRAVEGMKGGQCDVALRIKTKMLMDLY